MTLSCNNSNMDGGIRVYDKALGIIVCTRQQALRNNEYGLVTLYIKFRHNIT